MSLRKKKYSLLKKTKNLEICWYAVNRQNEVEKNQLFFFFFFGGGGKFKNFSKNLLFGHINQSIKVSYSAKWVKKLEDF